MSKEMINEIKALKSCNLKVLKKGDNVKDNLQKSICGSNSKYAVGK